jgi:hypothetical protein
MSPFDDPAVRAAAHELQATLGRMGDRLEHALHRAEGAAPVLTFRVPHDMDRELQAYMRRERILNQAEALRRLVALGLKAA